MAIIGGRKQEGDGRGGHDYFSLSPKTALAFLMLAILSCGGSHYLNAWNRLPNCGT